MFRNDLKEAKNQVHSKKLADFGDVLLLGHALKTKSPELAALFVGELEPKNAFDFFVKLADILVYLGRLSSRLIVPKRGSGQTARDFEQWKKDQEELADLSNVVQAIRHLVYESRDDYPEALDGFHARLRKLGSSQARELLDVIERRAALAGRFLSDLPEASSQSPEATSSAV